MPLLLIVAVSLLNVPLADAAPLRIDDTPATYPQIEQILQQIQDDLDQAHCGGWFDWTDNVDNDGKLDLASLAADADDRVVGKIPAVYGVPGRDGQYFSDIPSGMAIRDDAFIPPGSNPKVPPNPQPPVNPPPGPPPPVPDFSEGVWGFRTACRRRHVPALGNKPPCQRPLGGIDPDHPFIPANHGPTRDTIEFTCGDGDMPEDGYVNEALEIGDKGLCAYTNKFFYGYYEYTYKPTRHCGRPTPSEGPHPGSDACMMTEYRDDRNGSPCTDDIGSIPAEFPGEPEFKLVAIRNCCTHQDITGDLYSRDGKGTGAIGDGHGDLVDSCYTCIGEDECRFCGNSDPNNVDPDCPIVDERPRRQFYPPWNAEYRACRDVRYDADNSGDFNDHPNDIGDGGVPCRRGRTRRGSAYKSFYRFYVAGYTRDAFTTDTYMPAGQDENEKHDIPVSCYGFYAEKDAKEEEIKNSEKHCVIAAYYNDKDANDKFYRSFQNMKNSQMAKGGHNGTWDSVDWDTRSSTFDSTTDLWYTELGNAFSLTNSEVSNPLYNDDITMILYQPNDLVELTPVGIESSGALVRAFDDATHVPHGEVNNVRPNTETWQLTQTRAHQVLAPYNVTAVIPPAWSLGLDPLQPLFVPELRSRSGAYFDPRTSPLNVQLEAREDLLDEIKVFLRNMLLFKIEEEPIPILQPLASSTELRAYAEGWHRWVKMNEHFTGNVNTDALDVALKLEEYARQVEQVRLLRSELAKFTGKLFAAQVEIYEAVGEWLDEDILQKYNSFRDNIDQLAAFKREFERTQRELSQLHDVHSLAWCHNERFTVPIHSLLDRAMESRPNLEGFAEIYAQDSPSLHFDFTALKAATGSIKIPVIDPIQVAITKDFIPPYILDTEPAIPTLADLPDVPLLADFTYFIPKIYTGTVLYPLGKSLDHPLGLEITTTSGDIQASTSELSTVRGEAKDLKEEYRDYWQSMDLVLDDADLVSAQDCYRVHDKECIHSEMDLFERIMRFGSRPMVLLYEDMLSIGDWRPNPAENIEGTSIGVGYGENSCPPEDWACQMLRGERWRPHQGWVADWYGEIPEQEICPGGTPTKDPIAGQRVCMFEATHERLGVPFEERIPYKYNLESLTPSFRIPRELQVVPHAVDIAPLLGP